MSFFKKANRWPNIELDEIRKRSRILVIDDEDFLYIDLFKSHGYNIEQRDDVDSLNGLIEDPYDVILLDIQGVGRKVSPNDQGLGILRYIKERAPAQMVVAYSASDYSLKYQEFFKRADAVVDKASDFVVFKDVVDKLLVDKFSIGFYVGRIVAAVGHTNVQDAERLARVAEAAILNSDPDKLKKFLRKHGISKGQVATLSLQIVNTAINIMRIWSA